MENRLPTKVVDNVLALHHRVDGLISVSQGFRMRLNPCTT